MSHFNFNQKLGHFLKKARESKDFTQREVSDHLGLASPQFVSNIERGKCAVPKYILKEMVLLYSLNENEFIEQYLKWSEKSLRILFKKRK